MNRSSLRTLNSLDKLCGLNETMNIWRPGIGYVELPAPPDFRACRIADDMRKQGFNDDEIEKEIISDRLQRYLESWLRDKQDQELKKAERRAKEKAYRDRQKQAKADAKAAINRHNSKAMKK